MNGMPSKKLYTTHEVARLIGVTPITVIRWLESGKFKCYTTVGGHRRIDHDELVRFAKSYNLPWQGEVIRPNQKESVVLAVDDEPDVLELLRDILSSVQDLKLVEATNGFSAGAKLVEQPPDLILLDFLMPELDGFEFCHFVKQDARFKHIPIIAVTALNTEPSLVKIKAAGVNEIVTKPFNSDYLIERVLRFLSRDSQSQSAA